MTDYTPPTDEQIFLIKEVIGLDSINALDHRTEISPDLLKAILTEAAKLGQHTIAELNKPGDTIGAQKTSDGGVSAAPGYQQAYGEYQAGGWPGLSFPESHGGQNLAWPIGFAVQEIWQAADLSFGLIPLLSQGAIEAIHHHGNDHVQDLFLEKLISGQWTGTMNLTESQAGSDLSKMNTTAVPADDDTYFISGQKIYITWGDHDLTDNIIHLVLARLPNAPEGVKGISLFAVPKILPHGTNNGVNCLSLEEKLGIHGSPTCVMEYDGATGWLVGQKHAGLAHMFTMMNNARLSVGLQGVAMIERAYQKSLDYAHERVQGRAITGSDNQVAIIRHPDVMRQLMTIKSAAMATRCLTYHAAHYMDAGDDAITALLTPVVKGWITDLSVDLCSTGLQVHGGMGYVEETGIAQLYRDVRILPIYEGTNGIQAMDLMFRKTLRDNGKAMKKLLGISHQIADEWDDNRLTESIDHLSDITDWILEHQKDVERLAGIAHPFMHLTGITLGGVYMAKAALRANQLITAGQDHPIYHDYIQMADFYADYYLAQTVGLAKQCRQTTLPANFFKK